MRYQHEGVPLVVLAGKEYGSGSSRDWAAKGTALLGVRAVIAESYERIHRSNLVGMGVLPLQYQPGESAASLGLTGHETFSITGLDALNDGALPKEVAVTATDEDGTVVEFTARVRIDTPMEAEYYRHGGHPPLRAAPAGRLSQQRGDGRGRLRRCGSPGRTRPVGPSGRPACAATAGPTRRASRSRRSPSPTWLRWLGRAASLRSKVAVVSTTTLGARAGHQPELVDRVGLETLVEQLGVGEGVAGIGVDGADRRLAGGQVVGVAGVDAVPVALGRLGEDPLGAGTGGSPG